MEHLKHELPISCSLKMGRGAAIEHRLRMASFPCLYFLALLWVLSAASSSAQEKIAWTTDLKEALDRAKGEKKPVLIAFKAGW